MAMRDAGAGLALTQRSLIEAGHEMGAEVIRLDSDWNMIGGNGETNPQSRVADENLAFITYTSGSTAAPS